MREAGIKSRILVLGYTSPLRVAHAIKANVTLNAYDFDMVRAYAEQAANLGEKLIIHAKIDTGMGRLGIRADQAEAFVSFIDENPSLEMEGMFTHFACADEPGKPYTAQQLDQFNRIVEMVEKKGIRPPILHASNPPARCISGCAFQLVRAGISVYGLPHRMKMCLRGIAARRLHGKPA